MITLFFLNKQIIYICNCNIHIIISISFFYIERFFCYVIFFVSLFFFFRFEVYAEVMQIEKENLIDR